MLKTWGYNAEDRPTFKELLKDLRGVALSGSVDA